MMPHIESQAQREALIADCKAEIEYLEGAKRSYPDDKVLISSLLRQQITLAALDGAPDYFINRVDRDDMYGSEAELRAYKTALDANKAKDDFGGYSFAVFSAPTVPVIKPVVLPNSWPEGGDMDSIVMSEDEVIKAIREAGYPISGE